jgi:hypothetical protein
LPELSGVGGVQRRGVAARRGRGRDRVVLGCRWLVKKEAWGWLFPCVFRAPMLDGSCRRVLPSWACRKAAGAKKKGRIEVVVGHGAVVLGASA